VISVIVPAYNAEKTLAETLASILGQTKQAQEIVVVDDGSTDGTPDVARQFNVMVVRHTYNLGVSAAINTGLAVTVEQTVAIVDADDLWDANKLAVQCPLLKDADVVVGHVQEFVDPGEDASRVLPRTSQVGWLYGASLVRRSLFGKVGFMDPTLRTSAWVDWVHRARTAHARFAVHPEIVLKRRVRSGSLSSSDRGADLIRVARAAVQRQRNA